MTEFHPLQGLLMLVLSLLWATMGGGGNGGGTWGFWPLLLAAKGAEGLRTAEQAGITAAEA